MEEKKSNKVALLIGGIIALAIVLVIIAYGIISQNSKKDKELANLNLQNEIITNNNEDQNSTNLENVKDLIDDDDFVIDISEFKNADYKDNAKLQKFFTKYSGKKVEITGYVSSFGKENAAGDENALTYITLGDETNYKEKSYVTAHTSDAATVQTINNLNIGGKVTVTGIVNSGIWPLDLSNVEILQ